MIYKVYLDSCIFVAHFLKEKTNDQYKKVETFLKSIEHREDIQLFSSTWALTETIKVLVVQKNIVRPKVRAYSEQLMRQSRIGNIKFEWLKMKNIKDYDLDEFFWDYQVKILEKRIGTADIMHTVIMGLFEIPNIVTFNDKDFKKFKDIKTLKPQNISKVKLAISK